MVARMKKPPIPGSEADRIAVLRSLQVLDTAAEPAFDAIVELASHIAGAPISLISLVDVDRQWFKARVGLGPQQTSRDVSFCAHAVAAESQLVVPNALDDERFADNPLVTGDPEIRFYAGMPLRFNGQFLGTLCVIDREPRELGDEEAQMLRLLAAQVERLIELRQARAQADEARDLIKDLFRAATGFGDVEPRIDAVLQVGCERFGAELAIVSRIVEELYTVRHVVDRADLGVHVGTQFVVAATFCNIVLATQMPLHIASVGRSKYSAHPAYRSTGLESYIGTRLFVAGELYGTLNFSSPSARGWNFAEQDVEALQLMAAWIGAELTRELIEQQRAALVGELEEKIVQLQRLEGLIPICSWCKNVRNDSGAWQGLERYVHTHTGAQFSHGICPPCRDEHFPEDA